MTPGTTNPLLGDDCEDIANLDTTPHVMLAEEMPDEDNCGDEGESGDSDEEIDEPVDSGQYMGVQGAEDAESNSTISGIDTNDQPPCSPLGVRDKLYSSQVVLSLYEGVPMLELIGEQTTIASTLLRNMGITRRDIEIARSLDNLNTIDLRNL